MAKRDYYEILGVSKDVSAADLKKAYHRVAMKYHPDQNPDDKTAEDKFKETIDAYEVLSDTQQLTATDQFRHAGPDPNSGISGGAGGVGHCSDIFGDVFGDIFGGGRGRGRGGATRGSDLRYNLDLTL